MNDVSTVLAAIYNFYCGREPSILAPMPNAIHRNELAQAMNSFLSTLEWQRRIQDFRVIVDDTVNPPGIVDLGFTNCLVYWKLPATTNIKVWAAGEPQWVANVTRPSTHLVPA